MFQAKGHEGAEMRKHGEINTGHSGVTGVLDERLGVAGEESFQVRDNTKGRETSLQAQVYFRQERMGA